ncbi:AAA family ATPase [Ceratobasidium sp. AG-Ba]|nr:AAA family ATPase [Ceratobasidium sp. AG-Ba]QRW07902.1 AAA family ATPase [Ceratobasidium sp. AG-Ba]
MDSDTKAILDFIASESDDPMAALAANLGPGGLPPGVVIRARCSDSKDNDGDDEDDLPTILRRIAEMEGKSSEEAKAGPSTPPAKDNETSKDEPMAEVDEVVERVKKSRLESHEKALLSAIVDTAQIEVTFDTVCLPDDTIDMLRSMVSLPLICPEEFQSGLLKQYTMSGALLFGPPGTGKTLFAQALAKESGARMISVKPSDILHMCVGESERLVKALFSLARKLKPCVVFIDELDALFGARTSAGQQASARWHTSMLTEFMQEMDGLISSQVIVIGATNRPADLDDAVLRRLPCRILIDLPEKEARRDILKVILRDENLADDVKLDELANQTTRYSGSDLKTAFNAVKENANLPWKSGAKTDPHSKGKASVNGGRFKRFEEVDESTTADAKPENPSRSKTPVSPTRVIAQRHFTRALREIPPSTSSDTQSSRELQAWNAKFGSGGNRATSGLGVPGLGSGIGGYGGVPSYTPGAGAGSSGMSSYNPGGGSGSSVPPYLSRPGAPGASSYSRPNPGDGSIGSSGSVGLSGEGGTSRFGASGGMGFGAGAGAGGGLGGMSGMGGIGGLGGAGGVGSVGGMGGSMGGMSGMSGMSGMGGMTGMGGMGGASGSRVCGMGGMSGLGGMGGALGGMGIGDIGTRAFGDRDRMSFSPREGLGREGSISEVKPVEG